MCILAPMFGYRHAFHAGNHADVLKHLVLVHTLRYLKQKDTPLLYVDTHAGAGIYALESKQAALNREWETGFAALRRAACHPLVQDYLALETDGEYRGSPALAARLLGPADRLVLFELHPTDFAALHAAFQADSRPKVQVEQKDGFSALQSCLPPPSRRGLVLIDPSYELASDYKRLPEALRGALRRFATGVYIVWYPLLERPEAQRLPEHMADLSAAALRPALSAELRVRKTPSDGRGMNGSGVFIINPPWPTHEALSNVLPVLTEALAQDESAAWTLTRFN